MKIKKAFLEPINISLIKFQKKFTKIIQAFDEMSQV
jgi:hypothetical protein